VEGKAHISRDWLMAAGTDGLRFAVQAPSMVHQAFRHSNWSICLDPFVAVAANAARLVECLAWQRWDRDHRWQRPEIFEI
jgi:hypothetical protein